MVVQTSKLALTELVSPHLLTIVLLAGCHVAAHFLGLTDNSVPALILSIAALLAYCAVLALLPAVWPGHILNDMATRIEAMNTRLHDEAARRRSIEAASLTTDGLRALQLQVPPLSPQIRPLTPRCVSLRLRARARRCQRGVAALCRKLEAELLNSDTVCEQESAAGAEQDTGSWASELFETLVDALLTPSDDALPV
ncbi:hypothetical protein DFH09DRAFT_1449303 [Mycena vulgaris]|nr:hypothetical protein DFH09DRAFT_1449303 [Mycena vulgaris]